MAKLVLEVTTDAGGAIRNIKQFGAEVEKTGKRTSKLRELMKNVFTGIGLGVGLKAFQLLGAGARAAAGSLDDLIKRGPQIDGVARSFRALSDDYENVLASSRKATSGLVADFDLMAAANKSFLLGLPVTAESMGVMAKSAVVLGRAMKQDATKSLDDLITALGRSSPLILDNLGLTVKVGEANTAYAATLGKTASQLTEAEKKTAFYTAAMAAAEAKVAEIGDIHLTVGDRIQQMLIVAKNLWDDIARGIANSPAMAAALGALADAFDRVVGQDREQGVQDVIKAVDTLAISGVKLAQVFVSGAQLMSTAWGAVKLLILGVIASIAQAIASAVSGIAELSRVGETAARAAGQSGLADSIARGRGQLTAGPQRIADAAQDVVTEEMAAINRRAASLDVLDAKLLTLEASLTAVSAAGTEVGEALGGAAVDGADELAEGVEALVSDLRVIKGLSLEDLQPSGKGFFGIPLPTNNTFSGLDPRDLIPTVRLKEATQFTVDWNAALQGTALLASSIGGNFAELPQILANIGQSFSEAKTSGEKFVAIAAGVGQIGGLIGGGAGEAVQGAAGGALTGFSVGGPIGAAIGGAAGLVSSFFGSNAEEELNDIRDAFFETQGGFVALQTQLVGLTDEDLVKKIFDARTVEEFNAAVSEVMGLLDTQAEAQRLLNEAVERYGFDISQLGPLMQQQELDAMAGQLIQDFQLLTASGIDQTVVLEQMAGGFNEYIQAALASGTAIPEAMREQIMAMIEMGLLLDENGNAFTSIEESGIEFTETLTEGLSRVIESIDRLVQALSGDFPAVHIPVEFGDPGDFPDEGGRGPGDTEGFAEGGFVPATPGGRLIRVGEGGEGEFIVPQSQAGSMGQRINITLSPTITVTTGSGDPRAIAEMISEQLEQGTSPRLVSAIAEQART